MAHNAGEQPRGAVLGVEASLHERGVDLRIDSEAAAQLPEPHGGTAVYAEDPGAMKGWQHWVHLLGMRGDWRRED